MKADPTLVEELIQVARILYEKDLVDSHSGNLSVRTGASVWITRTGARLGHLRETDVILLALDAPDSRAQAQGASTEWPVHQAIYRAHPHIQAIIHAHPPYLTAWGWQVDAFVPLDVEGRYYVPQVPVVAVQAPTGSEELAQRLHETAARQDHVVIIRDHGAFSMDRDLDLALKRLMAAERSAHLAWLHRFLAITKPG